MLYLPSARKLKLDEGNKRNYQKEYKIIAGGCFATSNISLPIPYRTGYDFAGWYATPSPLPYVSGTFTDMTTVNSDITLYAKWVAINE